MFVGMLRFGLRPFRCTVVVAVASEGCRKAAATSLVRFVVPLPSNYARNVAPATQLKWQFNGLQTHTRKHVADLSLSVLIC